MPFGPGGTRKRGARGLKRRGFGENLGRGLWGKRARSLFFQLLLKNLGEGRGPALPKGNVVEFILRGRTSVIWRYKILVYKIGDLKVVTRGLIRTAVHDEKFLGTLYKGGPGKKKRKRTQKGLFRGLSHGDRQVSWGDVK